MEIQGKYLIIQTAAAAGFEGESNDAVGTITGEMLYITVMDGESSEGDYIARNYAEIESLKLL